jgi:hypothetical protein
MEISLPIIKNIKTQVESPKIVGSTVSKSRPNATFSLKKNKFVNHDSKPKPTMLSSIVK